MKTPSKTLTNCIYSSVCAAVCVMLFSGAAISQSTEVVVGSETTANQLPGMSEFTKSGGTKTEAGTGAQRGCEAGKFCTAGTQGPGGTYSTTFNFEDNMTIDDINRGFTMDYGVDVESHPSNSTLSSCVGGNVMQGSDCKDIFNLTLTLSEQNSVVHKFEHEVELDFTGVRSFDFSQIIPSNSFTKLTGGFELFGIDAGFSNGFFGPRFAAPFLTTTFDLITLVEAEVIDLITEEISAPIVIDAPAPVLSAPAPEPEIAPLAPIQIAEVQEIPTIELAPPAVAAPAAPEEVSVSESVVAEIEAEVEPQPEPQPEAEPQSEPEQAQPDESEPEEQPEATEEQPEEQPEATEERPADTREAKEEQPEEKAEPKKAVAQKAKEKAGKKIMDKMNDKSRYDATNQIRTLAVMNVISASSGIFKQQSALKDIQGFFQPTTIPDGSLPKNNFAEYMLFGGSDAGHSALIDTQYR